MNEREATRVLLRQCFNWDRQPNEKELERMVDAVLMLAGAEGIV